MTRADNNLIWDKNYPPGLPQTPPELNQTAHELFLLMLNLCQLRDTSQIILLFIDALYDLTRGLKFRYHKTRSGIFLDHIFEINTVRNQFGCISIEGGNKNSYPAELMTLIQNAVGMLAVILERNSQNHILEEEKGYLEERILDRTGELEIRNQQLQEEIHNRERIQQENEELIHKLEKQKDELEQFIYTLSHDLKTPLVTIKGFSGYLRHDLRDLNLQPANRYLDTVDKAADKMAHLLNDLLQLLRVGRQNSRPEWLHPADLIREILLALKDKYQLLNTDFKVDSSWPPIYGQRDRITELFYNLIENAIKYRRPDCALQVQVGCQAGPESVFFVKDNGIGLKPEYFERIFNLFEQLNPTGENTGVGLTISRRIIEIHGGRIWVESAGSNCGSTFYFTLPNPEGTAGLPAEK